MRVVIFYRFIIIKKCSRYEDKGHNTNASGCLIIFTYTETDKYEYTSSLYNKIQLLYSIKIYQSTGRVKIHNNTKTNLIYSFIFLDRVKMTPPPLLRTPQDRVPRDQDNNPNG